MTVMKKIKFTLLGLFAVFSSEILATKVKVAAVEFTTKSP